MRSFNTASFKLLRGLGLLGLLLATLVQVSPRVIAATPPPPEAESAIYVFRVTVNSPAEVQRLTGGGWDVLEARGPDYLLVLGDSTTANRLRAEGFMVVIDHRVTAPGGVGPFTFYGGYRTVVEHYQHLTDTVAAHPDLALVVDYGDSWRKQQALGGYDLRAICLTKLQPGDCALSPASTKPRFFLMAAIHARELSTAEMTWRWIDHLVNNYNVDPEVTMLLDYNELWVVPVVNPDGREVVESGGNNPILQRKNLHNYSTCTGTGIGVDLNRNASFQWGGSGSSGAPCADTYRGPTPASEPEEYYLEALMATLFPDQRGALITDTAPLTTTGAMLTLHTYSNLALFPWGWVECSGSACPPGQQAPNDTGLRSWGFRLSYFNNYKTGQPSEVLYAADGTTDDWAYGALGIAAGTFEIGPQGGTCGGFLPPYSCQDNVFWSLNRPAFMYAANVARQPYALVLGPTTFTPTVSLTQTLAGAPVTVTATTNDNAYGNAAGSVGRPTAQTIMAGEVYVDTPPWAGGAPISMTAQDGAFNSTTEILTVVLDTSALSAGRHTLFVRGQDAAGNWGPVTAQWMWVSAPQLLYLPVVRR